MLGAGEVKTSAGSLLARSSESKEEEVGKQPTQSRCPKLKVTDGKKEGFILGAIVEEPSLWFSPQYQDGLT